jgi:hypothetical protein
MVRRWISHKKGIVSQLIRKNIRQRTATGALFRSPNRQHSGSSAKSRICPAFTTMPKVYKGSEFSYLNCIFVAAYSDDLESCLTKF